MSLENDLFSALKSFVGNRMRPNAFPQPPVIPTWPAIRYTVIDSIPVVDVCGDGDDETATPRVQLDIVAITYEQARSVRLQVMNAMRSFDPPAILETSSSGGFDPVTNTHSERLDYTFHGSSS
jgi:hypothetical protein